jgi:hypothetical protein
MDITPKVIWYGTTHFSRSAAPHQVWNPAQHLNKIHCLAHLSKLQRVIFRNKYHNTYMYSAL